MTAPRSYRRSVASRILMSILIAAASLYVLARAKLPAWPGTAGAPIDVRFLFGAITFAPAVELLRALRLRHLVRGITPISLRELAAITWTGQLAAFVLPLRLGELVRPGLYVRLRGVPFETALAMIGAERAIDVLLLTGLGLVSLPFGSLVSPLPNRVGQLPLPAAAVPATIATSFAVFAVIVVAMIGFHVTHRSGAAFTQRLFGSFAPRVSGRMTAAIERFAAGMKVLTDGRAGAKLVVESLLLWISNGVVLVLLAHAVGLEPFGLPRGLVLLCTVAIGSMLPAGPAVLGAFQAAVYGALAIFLSPEQVMGIGPQYVFALYVFTVATVGIHGLAGVALMPATGRAALGWLGPDPKTCR